LHDLPALQSHVPPGPRLPRRIAGLHTEPGGHSVHGGISFPIEADDEPIASPEDAPALAFWGQVFLAAVTVACVGGVALAYLKS
jgi:hypothetical protein